MENKRGFTLTELLVVVSLISFLAILVTSYFRGQIFKANDAKRKANLQRISQALEEYEKDFSCYPTTATNLQPYLNEVPKDPVFKTDYGYEKDTASACAKWFKLYSKLENKKDPAYKESIGPGGIYNFSIASPNSP
jgi:prepilin-type N-terminal cleavage/methylation domain-containing protein